VAVGGARKGRSEVVAPGAEMAAAPEADSAVGKAEDVAVEVGSATEAEAEGSACRRQEVAETSVLLSEGATGVATEADPGLGLEAGWVAEPVGVGDLAKAGAAHKCPEAKVSAPCQVDALVVGMEAGEALEIEQG